MMIDWPENTVPVLTIESPKRFRATVQELIRQCDGGEGSFVLSENWELLDMFRCCTMVTEPFNLDTNNRQITAALTKWLKLQAIGAVHHTETLMLQTHILQWISELALECEEPLCWNGEVDVSQLFKLCNITFEGDDCDIPEKLQRYVRIMQTFAHKSCFIFVNLKRYLTTEELSALYRDLLYRKVQILLLENVRMPAASPDETFWTIDKDDCEIYADDV